jgi:hypothetical protein
MDRHEMQQTQLFIYFKNFLEFCFHVKIRVLQQPTLRTNISFNFGSYLKIKFGAHLFVDNQMADLENEVTQYESPNTGIPNPLQDCTVRTRN